MTEEIIEEAAEAVVEKPIVRKAVIDGGKVVNVIDAPEDFELEGFELVHSETAQIGQSYANGVFSDPLPPPEVFEPIEAWRFEAAIELAGIKSGVDAAIDALPEPNRTVAKAKRARSQLYHRDDPLIAELAPAVNLTSEQVDDLWRLAASL